MKKLPCKVVFSLAVVLLYASVAFAANNAPVVNTFTVATTAVSPIPVTAFTASDSDGTVAGYLITTSSSKPSANASGWTSTVPTSFSTGTAVGPLTLYAWAKDNLNAVSSTGKSASTTVVGTHVHAMSGVTGLTAALAAKVNTSALEAYQQKYAQLIVVAKSGGDFTDPVAAMDWIIDASATKPYLVKVMPGEYNIGANVLAMKEFVDIEGSGEGVTKIVGDGASVWYTTLVLGSTNASIRNLTLTQTLDDLSAAAIAVPSRAGATGKFVISRVTVNAHKLGLITEMATDIDHATINVFNTLNPANSQNVAVGIYNYSLNLTNPLLSVSDSRIMVNGGETNMGIFNQLYSHLEMKNVDIEVGGGTVRNDGINSVYSSTILKNVDVIATGTNSTALYLGSTANPTIVFQGSYSGDTFSMNKYSAYLPFSAAGAQFIGAIGASSDNKFIGCFDGNWQPIP